MDALDRALADLSDLLRDDRKDPELNALMAETTFRKAKRMIEGAGGGNPSFFLQDAVAAAERALTANPDDLYARATLARASYWNGDVERGADEAAAVLPALGPMADARLTAELLEVIVQGRTRQLYAALGGDAEWPAEWARQVVDAAHVQSLHPSLTAEQALSGASLLENLEDYAGQAALVRRALTRFPANADLHSWLRWQVLRDGDGERAAAAALEVAYDDLRAPEGYEATWLWFEGYAQNVAGDTHSMEGDAEAARRAYQRAIETFQEAIDASPDFAESAGKHIAEARRKLGELEG